MYVGDKTAFVCTGVMTEGPEQGTVKNSIYTLLLLLLNCFSRVRLCVTPSLGFSRQGHWSGLPFPSPVHESEK